MEYLFKDFIKTFFVAKAECGGIPPNTDVNEMADYFLSKGIQIDPSKVHYNSSKYFLSKQFLNCLWGRVSLRTLGKPKHVLVKTMFELWSYINSPEIEVKSVICGTDRALVKYIDTKESTARVGLTNCVVGGHITSLARLKLYELIEKLGDRICYVDTDSVLFKCNSTIVNQYMPTLSKYNFLGELSCELSKFGFGSYASAFISTGPKCYSLKVVTPASDENNHEEKINYVVKSKGFSLNKKTEPLLNFESYKSLVTGETDSLEIPTTRFSCLEGGGIQITNYFKNLTYTFNKRIVKLENGVYNTYPFGYVG
ncbi:unnamed protein product [Rotaria magnacalcarata]|nr:unnamed protein product [Rotaria magnacalcarata]